MRRSGDKALFVAIEQRILHALGQLLLARKISSCIRALTLKLPAAPARLSLGICRYAVKCNQLDALRYVSFASKPAILCGALFGNKV